MNRPRFLMVATICLLLLAGCSSAPTAPAATIVPATVAIPTAMPPGLLEQAREKIKHVVIIMQENRSFDSYFGTFPGADGIPTRNGQPTVCNPDPLTGLCVAPFHHSDKLDAGGPHTQADMLADVNGGNMDGFVRSQRQACAAGAPRANCAQVQGVEYPDVMGFHDAREIPNYWTYAEEFVLQDRMFPPVQGWSLPVHLWTVSGWSAVCSADKDPFSCVSAPQDADLPPTFAARNSDGTVDLPKYEWTDITHLLHLANVSWAYYVDDETEFQCLDETVPCVPEDRPSPFVVPPRPGTPEIWNPLLWFDTVHEDNELARVLTLSHFYDAAKTGTLPAVSWIIPSGDNSEHPYWDSTMAVGQAYVTGLINAIMSGPNWGSTAIFVVWDDWGGFYDHVVPPQIDENGLGIRVAAFAVSPYAKRGYIDHQTLSFDSYLKLIEDIFLNGQRIDPKTDGRPDPRPQVREDAPELGDLLLEFDFSQPPRAPLILPTDPPPGPTSVE